MHTGQKTAAIADKKRRSVVVVYLASCHLNVDWTVLTEEEAAEQKALRAEYIADFRASFTGILENTVIQYPDGSRQSLPDMRDAKKNEKK